MSVTILARLSPVARFPRMFQREEAEGSKEVKGSIRIILISRDLLNDPTEHPAISNVAAIEDLVAADQSVP
jgi:hypothetical protein